MKHPKIVVLSLALAALSLGAAQEAQAQWRIAPQTDLSAVLDCHEEAGRTLVSAHRGGPSPGLPENAVETMDAVLTAIPAMMEIDVVRSPDGVHYLMHDNTLDRTTTGTGKVSETPWAEVETLFLVDEAGWVTPYRVPTLRAALEWARGRTVVQIDFKRSADFEEVIELIRQTSSENHVILIAYSVEQAARLHQLAPEMLLSVSISDMSDLAELRAGGVPDEAMVAFTGTETWYAPLWKELEQLNIEAIFGTLGRPPYSLDATFARSGTDDLYAELSMDGVDILATDRPRAAAKTLLQRGRGAAAGQCGVSRDDPG